jgi:hypothetical protein
VSTTPLVIVGDPAAAVCVGDVCEIPAVSEQAIVNRQLDADRV